MNSLEELNKLLLASGRTRKWLSEQTGHTDASVKQYLNGSKTSRPFMKKARAALLASERPPLRWDLLFETEEQFRKIERASRKANFDGILEFCRETLLRRAEAILEAGDIGRYRTARALKVAERLSAGDDDK